MSIDDPIDDVARLLARFGHDVEGTGLAPAAVAAAEARLGVRFPEALRRFYLRFGAHAAYRPKGAYSFRLIRRTRSRSSRRARRFFGRTAFRSSSIRFHASRPWPEEALGSVSRARANCATSRRWKRSEISGSDAAIEARSFTSAMPTRIVSKKRH